MKAAWLIGVVLLAGCYSGLGSIGGGDGDPTGPDGAEDGADGADGANDDDDDEGDGDGDVVDPEAEGILSGLRRLTRAEYDNVVEDLLGDTTRPATGGGLPEDLGFPFRNDYRAQQVSAPLVEGAERLAQDVARRLVDDPARLGEVLECTPTDPGDEDCLRQFITDFGRRAFRRPLTTAEVEAYVSLIEFSALDNEYVQPDFNTGLELVVAAMLQDPKFLYRVELGEPLDDRPGTFRLTDYEVATRLSFLAWGSTPDDELLDLAGADSLRTPDERANALQRLLDDPRALRQLDEFHGQWLGYAVVGLPVDLGDAMREETRALIDRSALQPGGNYLELFSSADTYVATEALAEHYGLEGPTPGWLPVADLGRGGILGQSTFLATHNNPDGTSPTKRGVFVREWLMCNAVPPPPPEAADDVPPPTSESPCKVERLQQVHHAEPSCAACHELFDPIGFGLENYDALGRFRSTELDNPDTPQDESVVCEITGEGSVPGLGEFSGPGELGRVLADSPELQACVVKQLHRFAVGRVPADDMTDAPRIDTLTDRFADSEFDFRLLMEDFVRGDDFVLRRDDEEQQ